MMRMKYMDSWEGITDADTDSMGIDIAVTRTEKVLMIGWYSHNKETQIWWIS